MEKLWFNKTTDDVIRELQTDVATGLPAESAGKRLETAGPNELAEGEKQSTLGLLLEQFKNPLLKYKKYKRGVESI